MNIELIDIGVNLSAKALYKRVDEVILQAREAGVVTQITTSSDLASCRANIALCRDYVDLYHTVGIHPHEASQWNEETYAQLQELSYGEKTVAIGETGLDYNRMYSEKKQQQKAFVQQLELAQERQLPVFLHQRDAFDDWLAILKDFIPQLPAFVWHCFTGGHKELDELLSLGAYVGVTGWICDERRGQSLRECIADIPIDRLMVETDAPYLTPRNMNPLPRFNQPAYLIHVVDKIAECREESREYIAKQSTANARHFFRLNTDGQSLVSP